VSGTSRAAPTHDDAIDEPMTEEHPYRAAVDS
jgi:hypothetical protein